MCGCRNGLDHHQRHVVPEPRRLFPCCERTERLRLASSGSRAGKIKVFGFPVSPKFADFSNVRQLPSNNSKPRVLYMIHAATRGAPELVGLLSKLDVDLTVTIGHADKLRPAIERAADG